MRIVADDKIPYVEDYFADCGDLNLLPGRAISNADVSDADILLVRSVTKVNEQLLKNSSIKFVGSVTSGADHLDIEYLEKMNIAYSTAEGFNAQPVADYVVSCIAALQLKGFLTQPVPKAAVIGVGKIGKRVVDYLKFLNFDVILCDPLRAEQEPEFSSIPLDQLKDLDLITLHVPLTKTSAYPTYHFINEKFLSQQKKDCILINTSRGAVIDTEALVQAGKHLHWCLDVWEHEPDIDLTILHEAFITTPHIAGYSIQSRMRGVATIYEALCKQKFITGKKPQKNSLPQQFLKFAGKNYKWQDIVLGIFNPLIMTAMMREILHSPQNAGIAFDDMRSHFNFRHEFAFTRVPDLNLIPSEKNILKQFGIEIISESPVAS